MTISSLPVVNVTGTTTQVHGTGAFNVTVAATGVPTATLAVSGLPTGLTYTAGKITGKVAKAGKYTVTITATNTAGKTTKTVVLTVS
jgi:hypothetical protein